MARTAVSTSGADARAVRVDRGDNGAVLGVVLSAVLEMVARSKLSGNMSSSWSARGFLVRATSRNLTGQMTRSATGSGGVSDLTEMTEGFGLDPPDMMGAYKR